jgi:tRNA nucleotidyltransferase (CCA-adding enzyme)
MKTFLVGGAVRDILLGLQPKDKDFVVVGSSVEEMLSLGFTQVGKDFPVFLHPETGDEHALARKERSTGASHTDFECEVKGITLEQDLLRRDLTINSMAMDMHTSEVIDPFGGQQDIKDKALRATSLAFEEDPLRVLRVARFLARLGDDWEVSLSTANMMSHLAKRVREEISPERVWKEIEKALMEKAPWRFLSILSEVFQLNIPRDHGRFGLDKVEDAGLLAEGRWAIFLMNLFPYEAQRLNKRVKAPTAFRKRFEHCCLDFECPTVIGAEGCLDILLKVGALHDITPMIRVLMTLSCTMSSEKACDLIGLWGDIWAFARELKAQTFIDQGFEGKELGMKIREERIKRIEEVLK